MVSLAESPGAQAVGLSPCSEHGMRRELGLWSYSIGRACWHKSPGLSASDNRGSRVTPSLGASLQQPTPSPPWGLSPP